jgi:hypothetical protein
VYPEESDADEASELNEAGDAGKRVNVPEDLLPPVLVMDVETVRGDLGFGAVPEKGPGDAVIPLEVPMVQPVETSGLGRVDSVVLDTGLKLGAPGVSVQDHVEGEPVELPHPGAAVDWVRPAEEALGSLNAPDEEGVIPGLFGANLLEAEPEPAKDSSWATIGVAGATAVLGTTGRPEKKEEE